MWKSSLRPQTLTGTESPLDESAIESSLIPRSKNDLAQRIIQTLLDYPEQVFLADSPASLTGNTILSSIADLKRTLDHVCQPDSRVGILFPNSAADGLAILAALACQRVPVILNPTESIEKLEAQIPNMGLSCLIAADRDYKSLSARLPIIYLNDLGKITEISGRPSKPAHLPAPGTGLILYTSGSMGEPKGVQIPKAGILYSVDQLSNYFGLNERTVAPVLLPMCHSMALNTQFLPTFFSGGKSTFIDASLSLNRLYRDICDSQGDFVALIGEVLRLCWEEKNRRKLEPARLVRHVQLAGGIIRSEHLSMAKEIFPNAVIHKGYGLTEGIRVSMINSNDPHFMSDTAGYPLPGQELQIRSNSNKLLGPNRLGHLYLKGPNVMLGYDAMTESPVTEDGFLKTGDLAWLTEEGRLVIHGRSDSIFKVQGERISSKEIEKAALGSVDGLRDAKCIPVTDEKSGTKPILFVEIQTPSPDRVLIKHIPTFEQNLQRRLPKKTWIPREVFILERFPRTYNGKLRTKVFAEIWQKRAKMKTLVVCHGINFKVVKNF